MKVQVVNESKNELPKYSTSFSAGCDVRADFSRCKYYDIKIWEGRPVVDPEGNIMVTIFPGGRALIPTGICTAIPEGYEIQVRPRSGLALKQGVTVLNTPGTIDADYRNEIGVILINHGSNNVEIKHGDRIAQFVLNKVEQIEWEEVDSLDETERGLGGFGSTGVK